MGGGGDTQGILFSLLLGGEERGGGKKILLFDTCVRIGLIFNLENFLREHTSIGFHRNNDPRERDAMNVGRDTFRQENWKIILSLDGLYWFVSVVRVDRSVPLRINFHRYFFDLFLLQFQFSFLNFRVSYLDYSRLTACTSLKKSATIYYIICNGLSEYNLVWRVFKCTYTKYTNVYSLFRNTNT